MYQPTASTMEMAATKAHTVVAVSYEVYTRACMFQRLPGMGDRSRAGRPLGRPKTLSSFSDVAVAGLELI